MAACPFCENVRDVYMAKQKEIEGRDRNTFESWDGRTTGVGMLEEKDYA